MRDELWEESREFKVVDGLEHVAVGVIDRGPLVVRILSRDMLGGCRESGRW